MCVRAKRLNCSDPDRNTADCTEPTHAAMSSDDEEDVKLYDSLERNRKRQRVFVSLSSSESEGDDDDDNDNVYDNGSASSFASPHKKRLRSAGTPSPAKAKADAARTVVVDEDDEEYADDLLTAKEREKERERERLLDREILEKLSKDELLSKTRAIMRQVKLQIATDSSNREAISLESDEDDDIVILPTPRNASGAPSQASATSAGAAGGGQDRGERIVLQVRSNGTRTDEIVMHSKEPFSVLYERFCDLHGLPRSAVQMSLDGENLKPTDTPHKNDLESGDLIDANTDFSKANAQNKKQLVRLILVVEGRRQEKFRIDVSSTLEKLHLSFCKRHHIADPDDVEMTVRGERLRLSETVEAHGLRDDEQIDVEIKNFVDPASIELNVRYDDKTTKPHLVVPSHKVETLVAQVASHLSVEPSRITLFVDGESMHPNQTFKTYELEGGELIDIKLRS